MAVTDSEYSMVYSVKCLVVNKYSGIAIGSINDTTCVRMDILVVGCDRDKYRLLFKGGRKPLYTFILSDIFNISDFDFVLRRRKRRIKAVECVFTGITCGERIFAFKHGIVVFEVINGSEHVATVAAIILTKLSFIFL